MVNNDHGGRAGHIAQGIFICEHGACICIHANARQARGETGVDETCDAPTLKLMLIEHGSGHPKAQAAPVRVRAAGQPEIDTALLESIFRTVAAGVAANHVERLNGSTRAVPTHDRAGVEGSRHLRFEWGVGNDLHRNGLIASEDVHAIQFNGEQGKIFWQECIVVDKHRGQDGVAGLVG